MSVDPVHAEAFKKMIENDSALRERLSSATDLDETLHQLAAAAEAQGIEVDEGVLRTDLELAIQYRLNAELTDEQLEGVAGGSLFSSIGNWMGTLNDAISDVIYDLAVTAAHTHHPNSLYRHKPGKGRWS